MEANMKRILLLGSGLVARPLVRYLSRRDDVHLTISARTLSKAKALIPDDAEVTLVHLSLDDRETLKKTLLDADVAISLLPATFHVDIARLCLETRTHLVTTSYISPEMEALDREAREKNILILNEIGLDPGIDHMTAKRIIDRVHERGGRIRTFISACGGLPSPDAVTNPLGYKFSWSPRGVALATKSPARFLKDGEVIEVPSEELFDRCKLLNIAELGLLEMYPNRDATRYIEFYSIQEVQTMYRGTLRNPGWCSLWKCIGRLGLLDTTPRSAKGMTIARYVLSLIGVHDEGVDPHEAVARYLGVPPVSFDMYKLGWIGLFSNEPVPADSISPLDLLVSLLEKKLQYAEHEKDMIILYHEFHTEEPEGNKKITSLLVDFGVWKEDTAMARTVSLPPAIASVHIAEGRYQARGVVIPVHREIYEPVLQELIDLGLHLIEREEPDSNDGSAQLRLS